MANDHSSRTWKELADQKEKEWKAITESRIQQLESSLKEKEKKLKEEKAKFEKLKEDFKYNLQLLAERDQELERYDASFAELKAQLNKKNAELSDLKIQQDDFASAIKSEAAAREELQLHYQQRLREKQAEVDSYRNSKDAEVNDDRREFEKFKRTLEQKLREVEAEADVQRRELTAGFEDALKKREHEFRIRLDEINSTVLSYELKAKVLEKELEIVKEAECKKVEELKQAEAAQRQLEKKLKETEWRLADTTTMKDAQMSDLQSKLQQTEATMARSQEDFNRKYGELDRVGREREGGMSGVREAATRREAELQASLRESQAKVEALAIQLRQQELSQQDIIRDRDAQMEKLREEMQELKEKWDRNVSDLSQSQVFRDVELNTLRENEAKLKAEIQQKKQDLERYKRELSQAAEREAALERSRAQLELDWQSKFEDVERAQYEKSEGYIKNLISARDEAVAKAREQQRELEQKDMLIRALQRDCSLALATLKKHDIPLDKNLNVSSEKFGNFSESAEIEKLQEQNSKLRSALRDMQQQYMNDIRTPPDPTSSPPSAREPLSARDPPAAADPGEDYTRQLEKEIRLLKKKNRELEDKVMSKHGARAALTSEKEAAVLEGQDNLIIKNHIQSLNDRIGELHREKVELTAQVRKQQARLQFLERNLDEISKQPRQKQVEIEQLQYTVNAQTRRHEAEAGSLRQRVSELEMQLGEARKEADEYYRSSLEKMAEITSLNNQISNMKMEMAESRPALNFGAQELVIQQLEDEVSRLRVAAGGGGVEETPTGRGLTTNANIADLQHKLRNAAKHIMQLAREKQQLIEIGNRLRAELKKAGVAPPPGSGKGPGPAPSSPPRPPPPPRVEAWTHPGPVDPMVSGKLSQLEQLQYQLTKQELQFAQRFPHPDTAASLDTEPERDTETGKSGAAWPLSTAESGPRPSSGGRPGSAGRVTGAGGPRVSWDDRQDLLGSYFSLSVDSSAQDLLRLADHSPSPSFHSPRMSARSPLGKGKLGGSGDAVGDPLDRADKAAWALEGRQAALASRPKSSTVSAVTRPKPLQRPKPKVRNYNIRDE